MMGGLQGVRLVVGIVQAKVVAVLLGASGTGLFSVYASFLNLGESLFGLGTAGSGVRQIAALAGRDDRNALARAMYVQIGVSIVLGIVGGAAFLLVRVPLEAGMAGGNVLSAAMPFLAASLMVTIASGAPLVIMQGMRKIDRLVMASAWGTLTGAITGVILIYFLRKDGIAPAFLGQALCSGLAALWFYRRLHPPRVTVSLRQFADGFASLIRLGFGFMATALFMAGTAYGIRLYLLRFAGLDATGLYQAAWTLSSFYGSMILQAMGTDFFPRISALSGDHQALNQKVNEQVEIGLILLLPGMLACAVAAPLILRLLYTAEFAMAVPAARWMTAGIMLRALAWPLAYMPLAMNRPRITARAEGCYAAITLALSYPAIRWGGLEGAAIVYVVSSLIYVAVSLVIARRLTGFTWSPSAKKLMVWLYASGGIVYFFLLVGQGRGWILASVLVTMVITIGCGWRAWHLIKPPRATCTN